MNMKPFLQAISDRARTDDPPKAEDYHKDGLLYCGRCGTPREKRITLLDEPMLVSCLCRCRAEAYEREQAEARAQEEAQRRERLRRDGIPEAELRGCTFARDDGANPRAGKICRSYVAQFDELRREGRGLLLYGPVGTGKTFLAACIANALIDRGHACLVTNFFRMSNAVSGQRKDQQAYIDALRQYELLVIDDLAAERDTEYMAELVLNLVDARYRQGLPLIVTTNLSGAELKNPAELRRQRTYSRLLEMCIPLEIGGADRRRGKLRENYERVLQRLEQGDSLSAAQTGRASRLG